MSRRRRGTLSSRLPPHFRLHGYDKMDTPATTDPETEAVTLPLSVTSSSSSHLTSSTAVTGLFKGRKTYTPEQKRQIVADLGAKFNGSKRACAKAHKVTPKMLRDWVTLLPATVTVEEDRAQSIRHVRRVINPEAAKSRGEWPELDKEVYEWIVEKRKTSITVDMNSIKRKALLLAKDKRIIQFGASNG